MITVRPLQGLSDCEKVVELTAAAFPEEVLGSGLTAGSWRELELEDLVKQAWCWPNIGLACRENGSVVGAVVLAFPGDLDTGITYADVRHRVGCLPTLWNWAYDQVLEERLKDYECLVEFIAVTPTARGQGVGTALLRWAEEVAVAGLLQRWPLSVRAMGHITMTLWVAADNAPATSMYARQGYATTSRTDCGVCACLHARLLTSFLGHPVWAHMSRQVPVPPEALAALPPAAMARGGASAREELVEVSLHSSSAGAGKTAAPGPLLAAALKRRQGSGGQEIALTEQRIGALAGVRQVSGAVGPSPSPSRAWTSGSEDLPAAPLVLYGGEGRGGGQSEGGGGTAAPVTGWSEGLGVPLEDTPEPGAFPDPVLALPRSEHGSWC